MKHYSKHTLNVAMSAGLWLSLVAAPGCGDALDLDRWADDTQADDAVSSTQEAVRNALSAASATEPQPDDEDAVLTLQGDDATSVITTSDADDSASVSLTPSGSGAGSVSLTPSGSGAGSVSSTPSGGDDASIRLGGADAGAPVLVPPGSVTAGGSSRVRVVGTNGSGCAGQEATVSAVADDLSSFSISFGGYTAVLGSGIALERRNCIFAIEIEPPPGMTYAVTHVPLSGQADLKDGATGRVATQYFYQGVSLTSGNGANIPTTVGGWSTDGAFAADQVQTAPCGVERALLVNTSAVVSGEEGAAPSSLTVDPVVTVQLALSACP